METGHRSLDPIQPTNFVSEHDLNGAYSTTALTTSLISHNDNGYHNRRNHTCTLFTKQPSILNHDVEPRGFSRFTGHHIAGYLRSTRLAHRVTHLLEQHCHPCTRQTNTESVHDSSWTNCTTLTAGEAYSDSPHIIGPLIRTTSSHRRTAFDLTWFAFLFRIQLPRAHGFTCSAVPKGHCEGR